MSYFLLLGSLQYITNTDTYRYVDISKVPFILVIMYLFLFKLFSVDLSFFCINWGSFYARLNFHYTRYGVTRKRSTKRLKYTGILFRKNQYL